MLMTCVQIIGKAGLSSAVLIGRGTALALAGNLEEAILDYSRVGRPSSPYQLLRNECLGEKKKKKKTLNP